MFGLGFGELVLILLIALVFIGPKKLPELAKGLGKGIRDFQDAAKGFSDQVQNTETKPDSETKVVDAIQQEEPKKLESLPTDDKQDTHS